MVKVKNFNVIYLDIYKPKDLSVPAFEHAATSFLLPVSGKATDNAKSFHATFKSFATHFKESFLCS